MGISLATWVNRINEGCRKCSGDFVAERRILTSSIGVLHIRLQSDEWNPKQTRDSERETVITFKGACVVSRVKKGPSRPGEELSVQ
jgi:hypothetical protein